MAKEENLHAGHRERTIDKLLSNPSSFTDHELLEVLLFSFLPRIDTNNIAHRLLNHFINFETLFSASAEDIMAIKGIGKNTASKIVLVGKLLQIIKDRNSKVVKKPFRRYIDYEDDIKKCFENILIERFIIFLLNDKLLPISKLSFDSDSAFAVTAKTEDIMHAFAIHKPSYIIMAHNHPSGDVTPSLDDDFATAKMFLLCQLHGIVLYDHVICSGQLAYSYNMEDKLEQFKNKFQLENFLRQREE